RKYNLQGRRTEPRIEKQVEFTLDLAAMNFGNIVRESTTILRHNAIRTILTILVISVGVGAFIFVVEISNAGSSVIEKQLLNLGRQLGLSASSPQPLQNAGLFHLHFARRGESVSRKPDLRSAALRPFPSWRKRSSTGEGNGESAPHSSPEFLSSPDTEAGIPLARARDSLADHCGCLYSATR